MPGTLTRPELTASDRCDRCGAAAQVRAVLPSCGALLFCGHHARAPEAMLKELEKKLRQTNATWTEDRLWDAFLVTAPAKVKGRSQAGRFADLVSLVRFSLQQQPVLTPFADSVQERYERWLRRKEESGAVFTSEQRAWLGLIRDHIATSLSIEPDDFDYAPFSHRGGLGKAHQLFGSELPRLLDELNEALAA